MDSRQAVFLFLLHGSKLVDYVMGYMCGFQTALLYIATYWTMVSCSCLIMSFLCLFLAIHIIPPRKWEEGLQIESSFVEV